MNSKISISLLLLLLIASFFQKSALGFSISILLILLSIVSRNNNLLKIPTIFLYLLLPLSFGLFEGISNNPYLIFKDLFYLMMPVVFFTCGVMCIRLIDMRVFLNFIVYSGIIVSTLITAEAVRVSGFSAIMNPLSARYLIGNESTPVGNPLPVIALAVLLFSKRFNIKLYSSGFSYFLMAFNLLGIYMFASRTYILMFLCFITLWLIDKVPAKVLLMLTLVCIGTLSYINIKHSNILSSNDFMQKTLFSFSEVNIGKYDTEEDIILKYRGYESYAALEQFKKGNLAQRLFGDLGQLVDLKIFLNLGEEDIRYIPIFHNGFIYILMKTGLIGVLIYVIFFGSLFHKFFMIYKKNKDLFIKFLSTLILGSLSALFISNFFVSSFFNPQMSVLMIFIGYIFTFYRNLIVHNSMMTIDQVTTTNSITSC